MPEASSERVVICIPVYNDWESVAVLVSELSDAMRERTGVLDVLIVDDGSDQPPDLQLDERARRLDHVSVLRLRRNVGHQRAIAIGLSHLHATGDYDTVVVMDGDGEDSPYSIPQLLGALEQCDPGLVVFAERGRRPVGPLFRVSYFLYRILYRLATGSSTRFGSFSAFRFSLLERLGTVSELWNHFAAGIRRARIPIKLVLIDRRERIAGVSKMGFVPLVAHGLSALSVFADVCAVRGLVFFTGVCAVAASGAVGGAVCGRWLGTCPVAATIGVVAGWLFAFSLVAALLFFVFSLLALHAREAARAVPRRDYPLFVAGVLPFVPSADNVPAGSQTTADAEE